MKYRLYSKDSEDGRVPPDLIKTTEDRQKALDHFDWLKTQPFNSGVVMKEEPTSETGYTWAYKREMI